MNRCVTVMLLLLLSGGAACTQPVWQFEQISNENVYREVLSSLWDGKIAWTGGWYSDSQVYYWDGESIRQISDSTYSVTDAALYDGTIAWWQTVGENRDEIFYWDGSDVVQVTDYAGVKGYPCLWDGTIVWASRIDEPGGASSFGIYGWDGTSIELLIENAALPSLYGEQMAYKRSVDDSGAVFEVFLWDGEQEIQVSSTSDRRVYYLSLWDGQIAYELGISANESEIWFWDGASNSLLFANGYSNYEPSVHSGCVAWSGYDGSDFEIFLWDGLEVHQVTDNMWDDSSPSLWIDGNTIQIAYSSDMGDYDYEIMLATAYIPEPSILVLASFASVFFLRRFRRLSTH